MIKKDELIKNDVAQELFEYIEVLYNRERFHSTNNYLSPVDYEMRLESA